MNILIYNILSIYFPEEFLVKAWLNGQWEKFHPWGKLFFYMLET